MKRIQPFIMYTILFFTASLYAENIGIVNITDLFSQSKFVQNANKKLQDNVKKMENQVQAEQKKLQNLVNQYENPKTLASKKTTLQKEITEKQKKVTKMIEEDQQKIRNEQNVGMQSYSKLVQETTAKIAKEKHLTAVLSSAAIVYADPTWIDVTQDVAKAMPTTP